MGLDISAYGKLALVGIANDYDDFEERFDWETHVFVFPDDSFVEWRDGLETGAVYQFDNDNVYHFGAGSYSGYNDWRAWLCRIVLDVEPETVWGSIKAFKRAPFFRLINFSDCEGIIGPKYSTELAKHFADYQSEIDAADCSQWSRELYASFRDAFEMAADGGLVEFH